MLGLDWSWLRDPVYQRWLLEGLFNTLSLACLSSFIALGIGIFGAFAERTARRPVIVATRCYVELLRNTPPILQMLFLYFTLTRLGATVADSATGLQVPILGAYACAAISLSLFGGSLCIEAFRSGFDAVPNSTLEAARSLGYSRASLFFRVSLPIALRISLPALANILTNLFKTTSQASIIAVPELMNVVGQIGDETFRTAELMMFLLCTYVVLVTGVSAILAQLEQRFAFPGYGR